MNIVYDARVDTLQNEEISRIIFGTKTEDYITPCGADLLKISDNCGIFYIYKKDIKYLIKALEKAISLGWDKED